MKKLSVFLAAVMLLTMLMPMGVITVSAETADAATLSGDAPTVAVENTVAKRGDTFSVNVRLQNNPGIISFKGALDYDSSVLEVVGAQAKDFEGVVEFGPTTADPFVINWVAPLSENVTTDGVVAAVLFRVKDGVTAKQTEITLSYDPEDVFDANLDNVNFDTVGGTITLTCGTHSFGNYESISDTHHNHVCTVCGEEETAEHGYDNACDADCNDCGYIRTVGDHVYDDVCDADCNVCGSVRLPGDHTYTNACDPTCNACGATRDVTHTYSDPTDADCDVCGLMRSTGSTSTDVLDGKTALFAGDSITYGGGEEKQGLPRRGWALRIGDAYGMTVTNNGKSGYALSNARSNMYLHTAIIEGDYDYVVLQGGINDAMESVAVGSIAATKNLEDFDVNTFAGGLERFFYYATTMHPDARIGFIITYDVPASLHGGNTRDTVAYWDMARQICIKWNIAYLDLHAARFSDDLLQTDTDRYLADKLHINSDGYDVLAPYIAEWMATLKPYNEVGYHRDDGSVDMDSSSTSSFNHAYDNDCDAVCNECGAVREVQHTYSSGCDKVCDMCTVKRNAQHTYDYVCDEDCNSCGEIRDVTHAYSSPIDVDCDVCGDVRTIADTTETKLYGKTALFMGDSITYGYGEAIQSLPRRAWAQRIGDGYGMIVTNNGANGHALSDVRPEKRLHTKFANGDFDYVVLHGGINDVMDSVALGSIAATKNLADFNVNTFAGGLERYFYYATTMYPDARIGFIINFAVPASTWGGNTQDTVAYWELAREICAKWNISYLDLSTTYFSDEILKTSTDECLMDTLHLNSNGYDVVSPYIADWMATLTPYNEIGVHEDIGGNDPSSVRHVYDNNCDIDCNVCGGVRVAPHAFEDACDAVCDDCGTKRVTQHTYDNACDTDCNICGDERTVNHVYDGDCDRICNECGDPREVNASHTYDDVCDTDCNICGDERTVNHVYDGVCDSICNVCDHPREVNASHTYDDVCDTDCNVCGDERTVNHVYDGDCDSICNVCDHPRNVDAAHTYDNESDATCNVCGNVRETTSSDLKIYSTSLSLEYSLTINYKVQKALIDELGYTDVYVSFEFLGERIDVREYTVDGDLMIFKFRNVAASQMTDEIVSTVRGTYNGVEYAGASRGYSIKTYCYNTLNKYKGEEYAKTRTLLVDMMHYGALSQLYMGYKTDDLVDADLTDEQLSWGSSGPLDLSTVFEKQYVAAENPSVIWKGAGLRLEDSVTLRYNVQADSFDGVTFKIETDTYEWVMTSADIVEKDGAKYLYFTGLNADQMSEAVYITAYKNGKAVSDTVRYSIESYAYSKQNDTAYPYLADMVKAMMRYGDSAYRFTH